MERTSALARIVPKARKGFVVAPLSFRPRGSVRAVESDKQIGMAILKLAGIVRTSE